MLTRAAVIRVLGAASQLIMTIAITRSLDSDAAGEVFFAYALVMLLSQVSLLGSEVSGLRTIAIDAQEDSRAELLANSASRIRFVLASSTVAGLGMAAVVGLLGISSKDALNVLQLAMTAATIPCYALVLLLAELSKGIGKPAAGLTFQNVSIPLLVVGTLFVGQFLWNTTSSSQVIGAILAASFLSACTILLIYCSYIGLNVRKLQTGRSCVLLKEARLVAPVSATPAIIQWSGAALLGVIASPADVAVYVVAARVTIAVSIIHSAVASVAAPRLAVAWHSGDFVRFRAVGVQVCVLISVLALPILLILFAFPRPVLEIFGASYAESGPVLLRTLIIGQIVAAIFGHCGTMLLMAGKYRISSLNSMIFGVMQVCMTLALVPYLQSMGAALASAITLGLGHLTTLVLVRYFLGIWPIPSHFHELGIRPGGEVR